MTRKIILLGFVAAAAMAQPVYAGGNAHSGPTVGNCISDGFYAGNVIPSQSPGPKVTNPDGSVRDGASVGHINQEFGGGALNAFCRATTGH